MFALKKLIQLPGKILGYEIKVDYLIGTYIVCFLYLFSSMGLTFRFGYALQYKYIQF